MGGSARCRSAAVDDTDEPVDRGVCEMSLRRQSNRYLDYSHRVIEAVRWVLTIALDETKPQRGLCLSGPEGSGPRAKGRDSMPVFQVPGPPSKR